MLWLLVRDVIGRGTGACVVICTGHIVSGCRVRPRAGVYIVVDVVVGVVVALQHFSIIIVGDGGDCDAGRDAGR